MAKRSKAGFRDDPGLVTGASSQASGMRVVIDEMILPPICNHVLCCHVLPRLPLPLLFRLRLLSRSWDLLIRNPAYLRTLLQQQCQPPWMVMVRAKETGVRDMPRAVSPKELIAYCAPIREWLHLPVDVHTGIDSAIGPSLVRVPMHLAYPDLPSQSDLAMASSGGLICCIFTADPPPPPSMGNFLDLWRMDSSYDYNVLVFNCLTGASRRLPTPPVCSEHPNFLYMAMFPDASATATDAYFVVLMVSTSPCSLGCFYIYSSQTGSWKRGEPFIREGTLEDAQNADLFEYCGDRLSAFNIQSNMLSRIYVPIEVSCDCTRRLNIGPNHCQIQWNYIFKWRGRIFLARVLHEEESDGRNICRGFKVRELTSLQGGDNTCCWVDVAQAPREYWDGFYEYKSRSFLSYFNFMSAGNMLCMTSVSFEGDYFRPLVYDLACDSWYHLPPNKEDTTDCLCLFAFQPNPLALP